MKIPYARAFHEVISIWKTLETRRFHIKATLMYKFLNDLSAPQLSNSFVKLNDTNINYNLRNIETDLALPRSCKNFLKRSFKHSGALLWNNVSYEAKTTQSLPLRSPCLLLDRTDFIF